MTELEESSIEARKRLPRTHLDDSSTSNLSDMPLSPLSPSSGLHSPDTPTADATSDRERLLHKVEESDHPVFPRLEKEINKGHDGRQMQDDESSDENGHHLSRYQQLRRWTTRLRQTFGTSFLTIVSVVYLVQGFTSFSRLAINYFFKDNLDLQPAQSQTLLTVMMFPWGIKPVFGIISDSFPIAGYHRKSYMIIFSSMATVACLLLSLPNFITSVPGAMLALISQSLASSVIDVVIDARVVEMSRLDPKHGANDLQSVSWTSMAVGGILGSFLSGPATDHLGVRAVFFFATAGPLLVLAFSLRMTEAPSSMGRGNFLSSAKFQFTQLGRAVRTPVIWKCALWVFLSGAIGPGYSQVTFYFATDVLHFSPEFLGTVSAFGYVFLLVGTLIYSSFFKDMSFRRIFFIAQLSLALVSLLDIILVTRTNLQLGIPDKAFVLGDAVIADVISRLKTMPVLVLCAKLCPKGVEGTLFALLMSISNFSYSVSEFWGALVCSWIGIAKDEYEMLWLAVLVRSVLKVVPVFFLFLIPATDPQEVVDALDFERVDEDETITVDSDMDNDDGLEKKKDAEQVVV